MTHIPQDIMDKTTALLLASCGQPRMADIAELVWEERRRCVAIAKWAAGTTVGGGLGIANGPEHQQGCKDAGEWIMTEIMEPT